MVNVDIGDRLGDKEYLPWSGRLYLYFVCINRQIQNIFLVGAIECESFILNFTHSFEFIILKIISIKTVKI